MLPRAVPAIPDHSGAAHLSWTLLATSARTAERLGANHWLRRRATRRSADDADQEVRSVLGSLPAPAGRTDLDDVGDPSLRTVPTLCDVSVTILGPTGTRPGAVIKIARSESSARELRRQRQVLGELHADVALGPWRALLPAVLHLREGRRDAPLVGVETLLPGAPLAALLSDGADPLNRLLAPATETIGVLHERTGRIETIESEHLRSWVDEPSALLRRSCLSRAPAYSCAVTRLESELHDALLGRRALVSWTHGDFTPGNVLVDDHLGHVTGIVDWGGGLPDQLALIDHATMLLAAVCQRRKRPIGAVVAERLTGAGVGADDPSTEHTVPRHPHADVLDDRTLTLLSWLRHVAEIQRKSVRYRRHRVWWALNVEPVLWALTVGP